MSMRSVATKSKNVFLFLLIVLVACSADRKYKVLKIFFDGVPHPKSKTQANSGIKKTVVPGQVLPPEEEFKILSRHPDFASKDGCQKCHEQSSLNFLVTKKEDLCFTCHDKKDFTGDFVHGPVAVRDCLNCHFPHDSPFPSLLKSDTQTLCVQCHDQADVLKNPRHSVDEKNCLKCHFPHTAKNRFFLKEIKE